jgi:tRNA-specific 2-thiouridylase
MSGGVDSSVAAALLVERGFDVLGATLKLWCYEEREAGPRACCSLEAIRDARAVALRFGFAHYVLDYTEPFRSRVIEPFLDEHRAGRTPYPCAACNADLKFGRLWDQARSLGAAHLASGHYVRRGDAPREGGGREPALFRAADPAKDQSYALWGVRGETLGALVFPLGELTKTEVRAHAERLGLARQNARPESQDLCFVGAGGVAAYVLEATGNAGVGEPGPVFDERGREVGTHRGLVHYTIGQRRLGRGVRAPEGRRAYVVAIEPERNALRIGPAEALAARVAVTRAPNWLSLDAPRAGQRVDAQIRYRAAAVPARLWPAEGAESEGAPLEPGAGLRVTFEVPQRAITPGQSVVFYDDERLLGGAPIDRAERA